MKRVNLRLDVEEEQRDDIRRAAAMAGYRSMAEFCRAAVLREVHRVLDPERQKRIDRMVPSE